MELWYYLLGVYSPNQTQINTATELFDKLKDTNYIEDEDVSQLAKKTNSVFFW